jgi:hypothetical protein
MMRIGAYAKRWCFTRQERRPWFALFWTVLYAAVQVIGHSDHELWKDELHCWGVGRASTGLWDMLTGERRYDGHPFLWYYLLHLASRVTRSYVMLHVVGVSVATACVYVWLRYMRAPRWLRLLFLPSYYMVYEYGVLSRSYTLGMLCVFVFCALYHPQRIRYVPLSFMLFLTAATSLYGTLIALCLALFLFTHGFRWQTPDARDDSARIALPWTWAAGLCVFGAGLALTMLTTWPPQDAMFAPQWQWDTSWQTLRTDLGNFWGAMLPFRTWDSWNWYYVDYLGSASGIDVATSTWFGLALLVALLVGLRKTPVLALAYALGIAGMFAVQHGIYPAALRHRGHYLILLLACVWLSNMERRRKRPATFEHAVLAGVLGVQAITGYAALNSDHAGLFSGVEGAVKFMRENHLDKRALIGSNDHAASAVAIALDVPMLFQETGETAEVVLEHNRRAPVDPRAVVFMASQLAMNKGKGSAIMVLDYDLAVPAPAGFSIRELYHGPPALMFDESYHIYEIKREASEPSASASPAP